MLLTCPACGTRFIVDPAALGREVRLVRCGRCTHGWYQRRGDAPTADVTPPALASEAAEPVPNMTAVYNPPPSRRTVSVALLAVAALVAATVTVYVARHHVVRAWPETATSFAWLQQVSGGVLRAPGPGILIEDIRASLEGGGDGRRLVVEGTIANATSRTVAVPAVEIILLGADETKLADATLSFEKARLLPGEAVPFRVQFADPPSAAVAVSAEFTTD